MPSPTAATPAKTLSAPQKALIKLGLGRDIDLALHLPLRYEDETRIVKLVDAREGDVAQIEATVTACEITMRGSTRAASIWLWATAYPSTKATVVPSNSPNPISNKVTRVC